MAASTAAAALCLTIMPVAAAQAHSLDSSTIAVRLSDSSAEATVSIALEAMDEVLGTSYAASETLTDAQIAEITTYIDEHLSVAGADGAAWPEQYSGAAVESVEGIRSFSVDVVFDSSGADPSSLVVSYDAIIEADAAHEAVVVLTDAAGDISTAGVITSSDPALAIGASVQPGLLDMIGHGFHHVLEGADHLLFLVALLLVAPLVVVAGRRWAARPGFRRSVLGVIGVVTAFTIGHSLTLIAAALGWISLPSTPVEVLVAASVAIAAVHAIRPLVRRGEVIIAGAFGLVHGLAFAGILRDLGLDGGLSIVTLLAFNVGVELAQLATVALVFPAIYVLSRTRWGGVSRIGIAIVALAAAAFWMLERIGGLASPIAGIEDLIVANSWMVAAGLAVLAAVAWSLDRRGERRRSLRPRLAEQREGYCHGYGCGPANSGGAVRQVQDVGRSTVGCLPRR